MRPGSSSENGWTAEGSDIGPFYAAVRAPGDAYTARRRRPGGVPERPLDPFALTQLLHPLIGPPGIPLVAALGALWIARRRPRTGRALLAVALAAAWALTTPWMAERLVRAVEGAPQPFDEATWRAERDGPSPPRAIVVLGGGLLPADDDGPWPDRPAPATVQRALAAARVARLTELPVLASGGRPVGGRDSEAGLMRALLERDLGVPVRWTEEASRDTAENAACSAAILRAAGIGRVLLVTHAFHMARARAAFEAVGIDTVPVPTDPLAGRRYGPRSVALLPSAEAAAVVALSIREALGRARQSIAGPSAPAASRC